ncbi:MAG: flagellar hook capping FlgD N-terminal domain-containing protein [Terriglobia bacterium]
MNIQSLSQNAPITGNSSSTPANETVTTADFMTLLTSELQAQDPTNPMSPTDTITQLAQFESLDQLSQINSVMQNAFGSQSGATQPSTNSNGPGNNAPASN